MQGCLGGAVAPGAVRQPALSALLRLMQALIQLIQRDGPIGVFTQLLLEKLSLLRRPGRRFDKLHVLTQRVRNNEGFDGLGR